ncbi:DNA polymerase [Vibrio toranzoniae]|uniref:DNA polymerase n=1 Tax=Vibrio toranzoniae TaxID=1194427 RepID=UPI0013778F03|nr:DNA polymerase [Vibrio toranzoniae]NAZ97311.1 DNA polymerase I [Vibrio toranzoniae]
MNLLPALAKRFEETQPEPEETAVVLPMMPSLDATAVEYVNNTNGLKDLIALAHQLPLTGISLDFEFMFNASIIPLRGNKQKHDIRSIKPLLMAATLVSHQCDGLHLHNYVIDLTKFDDPQLLQPLLDLPTTYIAHHAKAELHCIWQLGLTEPRIIWDTCIAERARYLGLHVFDGGQLLESETEEVRARAEHGESNRIRYALNTAARNYGIQHQFNTMKAELQQSFLNYAGEGFTQQQIHYAAEDAIVAAKLYLPQMQQLIMQGCYHHLTTIEMPWVITNAAMEWQGVRIDRQLSEKVLSASLPKLDALKDQLKSMGLENPNSHQQLQAFFTSQNLLHHFAQGSGHSFKKQKLKDLAHIHPAIALLAELKKVQAISSDLLLQPHIDGADRRIHPDHKQLEVVTGRQSCANPNLLGLPGVMRPLIIPEPSFGIGEADYSQIEVAITAAVYGDKNLIAKFNAGDIYTVMAQEFYACELSEEDQKSDSDTFKHRNKDKRDIMKTCVLGILYGLSPFGLGSRLAISELEAKQLMNRFLTMFPTLKHMMETAPQRAAYRGYVSTSTGLHRHRTGYGALTRHEKNWMVNMPVQGTAAALFKTAGNRLYQLYKPYGAKLILAMHDAFIYEAPLDHMEEIGQLTRNVMIQAVVEFFPEIKPRIDLNDSAPQCWTKDGDAGSVKHWIAER